MRSPAVRGVPALVFLVLLAPVLAAGGAVGAQDDAAATTMRIALEPDGDARWTVIVRFELDTENRSRAFDRLATEFESGESSVLSPDPYREAASHAENATDRSMAIESVSHNAVRSNTTGRLELSFIWTAFAQRSADRLFLGDAFQTESGTWLPRLEADQELIVAFPESFSVVDSSHNLEDRTYDIDGPASFEPGTPYATLVRGRVQTTSPGPTTAGNTTGGPTDGNGTTDVPPTADNWPAVGVGAVVVLVGALALLVERRRRAGHDDVSVGSVDDGPPGGAGASAGAAATEPDGDVAVEPDEDAVGDEPLLSDDERVLELLHRNDGRMKQARIVEETGWSNAKVSQLLSEMAENGTLDKLRIGRENLISLPGEGPDESE